MLEGCIGKSPSQLIFSRWTQVICLTYLKQRLLAAQTVYPVYTARRTATVMNLGEKDDFRAKIGIRQRFSRKRGRLYRVYTGDGFLNRFLTTKEIWTNISQWVHEE